MPTLADFNAAASAGGLLDMLRALPGNGDPAGTWFNKLAIAINSLLTNTAAAATVTIGGTPHAGDLVTVAVGGTQVQVTSQQAGGASTGTFTVGGTVQTGDTLIATVGGETAYYELTVTEDNATKAAAKLAEAIGDNAAIAANFTATSDAAIVTVTAKVFHEDYNVAITADIGGADSTTTLTASGGTLTGGGAGDTTTTLAVAVKNAINADPTLSKVVEATNSGAVVTLTAKYGGTEFNATTLTAAVTGEDATVTATAQAATFGAATAGTGADDIHLIA